MLKAVSLDAVVVSAKLPVPEGLDWLDQCRQSVVAIRGDCSMFTTGRMSVVDLRK